MEPITRREQIPHATLIERRKYPRLKRILGKTNPAMVIGALITGAVMLHLGSGAKLGAIECRPAMEARR